MKISLKPNFSNIFFFISFIAFHLSPCFSNDAGLDLFKACEVSYNCGNLVNISYPFWGNARPDFCGPSKFELKCNNNKTTTIRINSLDYYVLNINQSDQIMRIARSDLFDDYCPKSKIETATLDPSQLEYTENDLNMSIWYDCPAQEGIPEEFRFRCGWEGENTNSGRGNYALEPEAMYLSRNIRGCKVKMEATVMKKGLKEGEKNRTKLVETALREGFEVQYITNDPWCYSCTESGGACGGNATQDYYCICASGNVDYYSCSFRLNTPASVGIAIGSINLVIFFIILSILLVIRWRKKRKSSSNKDEIEETIKRYSTQIPKRYTYSELKKFTDSFKNKLGQGGFSIVYKGKLLDGRCVAVKLLNESRENGQDFINEVISITRTSHVNIVTFLGFCYEENKRALIYEYMPKGSLDKYIFQKGLQKTKVEMNWNTLYSIIVGVARGLEYLHRGCNTRILHFDIKPHNILLDNDFCPKISDFGLAKQCKARESHVSMTCAKGTIGFMAPEVIIRSFGKVSHKSDVYSYGMLVLEMVGERKSPNKGVGQGQSSEEYFPDWIYKDLAGSEIDRNCRQWGQTEEEEEMVRKLIVVSLYCIQTLPDDRPSMTEVVAMLEGSVDGLQIPPKPTLFESPAAAAPLPQAAASFSSSISYL